MEDGPRKATDRLLMLNRHERRDAELSRLVCGEDMLLS